MATMLPTGSARAGIEGLADFASTAADPVGQLEEFQRAFYTLPPQFQDELLQRLTGIHQPIKLDHVAVTVPQKTYVAVRDAVIEYSERHAAGNDLSPLTILVSDYCLAKEMHLLTEDRRKDLLYVETVSAGQVPLSYRQELNIFESPRAFSTLLDDMKDKDLAVLVDLDGNVCLTRTAIRARLTEDEEDGNPEVWNARHNSASAFCRYLPNSVAVVKSELTQGTITIMHGYHHSTHQCVDDHYDSVRGAQLPEGSVPHLDAIVRSGEHLKLAS